MITKKDFDELENEAELIFSEWLEEFEEAFNTRPATAPPMELSAEIMQLMMDDDAMEADDGEDW